MTPAPPPNLEALRREYLRILKEPGRKRLGAKSLRILGLMLEQPGMAAMRSISELAGAFDASRSSLTRLAQRLGYDGFPGLQGVFRNEVGERTIYYSEQVERFLQQDRSAFHGEDGRPFQDVAQAEWANVLTSLERFDQARYDKAISLLLESGTVYILGLRGSFPMAYYFAYYLKMIRDNVILLDNAGHILAECLVDAGPGDLLFAISAQPYTRLTLDACSLARSMGMSVAAITDSRSSPLASEADAFLLVSAKSDSFFGSITAGTLYITAILSELVRRMGEGAVQRLRRNEAALRELGIETG